MNSVRERVAFLSAGGEEGELWWILVPHLPEYWCSDRRYAALYIFDWYERHSYERALTNGSTFPPMTLQFVIIIIQYVCIVELRSRQLKKGTVYYKSLWWIQIWNTSGLNIFKGLKLSCCCCSFRSFTGNKTVCSFVFHEVLFKLYLFGVDQSAPLLANAYIDVPNEVYCCPGRCIVADCVLTTQTAPLMQLFCLFSLSSCRYLFCYNSFSSSGRRTGLSSPRPMWQNILFCRGECFHVEIGN